jgi:hypothetical protein
MTKEQLVKLMIGVGMVVFFVSLFFLLFGCTQPTNQVEYIQETTIIPEEFVNVDVDIIRVNYDLSYINIIRVVDEYSVCYYSKNSVTCFAKDGL